MGKNVRSAETVASSVSVYQIRPRSPHIINLQGARFVTQHSFLAGSLTRSWERMLFVLRHPLTTHDSRVLNYLNTVSRKLAVSLKHHLHGACAWP